MKKLRELFADEPVNTGRQPEIDLCRAVVVFFLATIHCFVECSTDEQLWQKLPYFFDSVLGGPWAAPMFIFTMGLAISYSRHNSPRYPVYAAGRGVRILLAGLSLNVCRYLIPSLVGWLISGDSEFYLDGLECLVFGNDLLQFAGLAMLFMALMMRLKLSPWQILLVGLGMNIVSTIISPVWTESMPLNILLGHLVGVDDGMETVQSDFPLMVWFMMYAAGYVFGGYFRRLKDKRTFYAMVSPVCLAVSAIVCVIEYKMRFGMMGGEGANVFYHATAPELLVCVMVELGMLGVYYMIDLRLSAGAREFIRRVSANVTVTYFIQWTLVWWTCNVVIYLIRGSKYLAPGKTLVLGLALSCASVALAEAWTRLRRARLETKGGTR